MEYHATFDELDYLLSSLRILMVGGVEDVDTGVEVENTEQVLPEHVEDAEREEVWFIVEVRAVIFPVIAVVLRRTLSHIGGDEEAEPEPDGRRDRPDLKWSRSGLRNKVA